MLFLSPKRNANLLNETKTRLMLCFGVGANFVHLYLCVKGAAASSEAPARRARAQSCIGAHRGMCFALVSIGARCFLDARRAFPVRLVPSNNAQVSMPPAMLLGGVRCGIDLMHAAAAPGMYLQVKAVSDAVFEADELEAKKK